MATGLERALKTVDIKGKAYVTVNERIKYFREHFTGYRLISDIVYQKMPSTLHGMIKEKLKELGEVQKYVLRLPS